MRATVETPIGRMMMASDGEDLPNSVLKTGGGPPITKPFSIRIANPIVNPTYSV